ncbi:M23 family metallopeptidase [Leptolyngbya sp. PCC 6406]|uniref:M23 family metallopeptidase n=1 Tax=Leptolyngbya sp. PCC 6406 TaxID=1173264 RepID=UPI0002AD14A7|nr:M23 family metallopeptidase [Leptolyngbya sp. PCC 6406]
MRFLRTYQGLWILSVCLVLLSSLLPMAEKMGLEFPIGVETGQAVEVHRDRHHRSLQGQDFHTHFSRTQRHRALDDGQPWDSRLQRKTHPNTLATRVSPATALAQNGKTTPEVGSSPIKPIIAAPVEATPTNFTLPGVLCREFVSEDQEYAPIQVVDGGSPKSSERLTWVLPTESLYTAPFSGSPGLPAGHEGIDYAHTDPNVPVVPVVAAAAGRIAYIRNGCPQSRMFGPNRQHRECGAGWGNHVVIDHGEGLFTRYAHLAPRVIPVRVGDYVEAGDHLGEMGNTGRSDTRHLHFELGATLEDPNTCGPAQSFERVYDPGNLNFELAES